MVELDQLNEYIYPIQAKQFEESLRQMNKDYKEQKEKIIAEWKRIIHRLLKTCIRMQEQNKKGKLAIVHICYLQTGFFEDRIEMQINAYDKQFYYDRQEAYEIWKPEFITKYYKKDMESLIQSAYRNVYDLGYRQIEQVKQACIKDYYIPVLKLIGKLATYIIEDPFFEIIDKEDEVLVLFGGYQEESVPVMSYIKDKEV